MKKLFILVVSLLVTLSMAIFYSNFRLFAMDSNVSTQQELIDAIGNNNNVVLSNDITISSAITIPSSYTATIKSDGSTKTLKLSRNFSEENMFIVKTSAKPIFENITLDGTERGRILDVESNAEVTIANSKLVNATTEQFIKKLDSGVNKQRYQGGAIYLTHATLNLDNVNFESNHTKLETPTPENSGDPGIAGHGGAIYSATSVINVKGGSFINNYTGVTVGGKGTNGEGGAIKLDGGSELNINIDSDTRTTFDGNHVYKSEANVGGLQGGAIEITHSTAKINNTDFIVKGGFDTGGAIKFEGAGTKENHNKITNSTFKLVGGQLPQTPEASTYFGTSGGAIMTENSFLAVEKSTFDTDTSKGVPAVAFAGGFIDVVGSGEFNLFDSALRGNGQLWNKPQLSTAKYGGAIAFENGASAKAHIKDTKFNEFTVDHTGGVISVGHRKGASEELGETTVDLTLENSTLDGARAYTYGANSAGAGLYISKGSNVVIKRGTISNMLANYGGAVYNMGSLTLDDNANLSGNFATQMAGGIYNDGYLNIHSAKLNDNQKTNDVNFSGGNHQFSPGEHSGGTIYAKQNVIIGTDASFSTGAKHDVRVIDGQSSVILSGPRNSQVNVSISETESTAGTGAYSKGFGEDAHRHVGYLVGKELSSTDLTASYIPDGMAQSYEPTIDDAKNFHYVSNTVEKEKIADFSDHESTGLWDYVYNPDNKTIVLGQRAKLVYHTNHADATVDKGVSDADPAGQLLNQVYTFYDSGNGVPKVSIDNVASKDLTKINATPNNFAVGEVNYKFKDWYNTELKNKPLFNADSSSLDDKIFDFGDKNTFTKTWHSNSTKEIVDILNFESKNTLNTYAVYKPVEKDDIEKISIKVKKVWDDENNAKSKRPTSVTIKLKADGSIVDGKTLVLNDDNNWESSFTELEKSKDGQNIEYSIEEESVNDYTTTITGDITTGFTVTNKLKTDDNSGGNNSGDNNSSDNGNSEKISFKVSKVWDDEKNTKSKRPTSVTIKLKADGSIVDGKTLVLNDDNNWESSFTELEKSKDGQNIVYSIEEESVKDYTSSIAGDIANGFTVTNKLKNSDNPIDEKPIDDENIKGIIEIRKEWVGAREKSVEVQLYKDGVKFGDSIKLNSENNWKYKYENLFVKENGKDVVYSVKEIGVIGNYVLIGDNKYKVTITENSSSDGTVKTFVIKNSFEEKRIPPRTTTNTSQITPNGNSSSNSGNTSQSSESTSNNVINNTTNNVTNNTNTTTNSTISKESSLPKTGDNNSYEILSGVFMVISFISFVMYRRSCNNTNC